MGKDLIKQTKDLDLSSCHSIPHATFAKILDHRRKTGQGVGLSCKKYDVKSTQLSSLLNTVSGAKELWDLALQEFLADFAKPARKGMKEIIEDKEHPDRFKACKWALEKADDNFKKESGGNIYAEKALVFTVKRQDIKKFDDHTNNQEVIDI